MTRIKFISFFTSLVLLHVSQLCLAQEKIKVLTRKVEQEFTVQAGDKLSISAERGIIRIKGWNEQKISVSMKIVSKNMNGTLAREELNYMKYSLDKRHREVSLRNFLVFPAGKDASNLSSILRVEYEIRVPKGMKLEIRNRFGTVRLHQVNANLNATLDYTDLNLSDFQGEVDAHINIGDFLCRNSSVNGIISTVYSSANIKDINGELEMDMSSGNIHIDISPELKLDLKGDKTDVMVLNRECLPLAIEVQSDYTQLIFDKSCYFPEQQKLQYSEDLNGEEGFYLKYIPAGNKEFKYKFKLNYGTLNLR